MAIGGEDRRLPETPEAIIGEVLTECYRLEAAPPTVQGKPDHYYSKFMGALALNLESTPRFAHDLATTIVHTQPFRYLPTDQVPDELLRLFAMQALHDPAYPYESPEMWRQQVAEQLFENPSDIMAFLALWRRCSNVETRVSGPLLAAHLLQPDRLHDANDPFTQMEVGSSRDHLQAMLVGRDALPPIMIPPVELTREPGRTTREHRALYDTINTLLAQYVEIGNLYGVELWSLRDELLRAYAEACRYYPMEFTDPTKRHRYQRLEEVRDADPRLHHIEADFALPNSPSLLEQGGVPAGTMVDQVDFVTSMYQNGPAQQRQMFDNGTGFLRSGGIIVVQDFCIVEPKGPQHRHPMDQLHFVGVNNPPDAYTTAVYQIDRPELGFRSLMQWGNGRCETIRPGKLFVELAAGR